MLVKMCMRILLFTMPLLLGFQSLASDPSLPYINSFTMPMHQIDNLICVEISVNGVKGNFIIDTGAPSIILNSQYFEGNRNTRTKFIAVDGSPLKVKLKTVDIQFGPIRIQNRKAQVIDIQHLELLKKKKIHGLIGYDLLKDYELILDYEMSELTVFCLDNEGDRIGRGSFNKEAKDSFQINLHEHFLMFDAYAGNKRLRMILDTGSEVSLFQERTLRKKKIPYTIRQETNVVGFGAGDLLAKKGAIDILRVSETRYPSFSIRISNLNRFNRYIGTRIDGIVGSNFFFRKVIGINFKKQEVKIYSPSKVKSGKLG